MSKKSTKELRLSDLYKGVEASDISEVVLDMTADTVMVSVLLPVSREHGEVVEDSATIEMDETVPQYLLDAAMEYTQALARALREDVQNRAPIPCEQCTAACCRNAWTIPVTKTDVDRMKEAGLDVNDLIKFYGGTTMSGCVGELQRVEEPVENPATAEKEHPCKSLVDNRCGIYEHRPQVCRDFSARTCGDMRERHPDKVALPVIT